MTIPIGLNTTKTAVDAAGGPGPYYSRLKGAYNVSRIMGNMTDESLRFLQECQGPAMENGIKLMPVLLFPNPLTWRTCGMADKYPTLSSFWDDGVMHFLTTALYDLLEINAADLWAVEVLNEVVVDSYAKKKFCQKATEQFKKAFPSLPLTISRPFPYGISTLLENPVTECLDFVSFHTYGPNALEWWLSPVRNEQNRLAVRLENVTKACDSVKSACLGKPFICTEDPILPARGPVGDFWSRIVGRPQDNDFAEHYRKVSRAYVDNGAMGPGMPWSNCNTDVPDGFINAMREEFGEQVAQAGK